MFFCFLSEFVYDTSKNAFPYNGPRKEEFIKKGLGEKRNSRIFVDCDE